jgi:hypothetical protein
MVDSVIRQMVAPTPAGALPPGFPEPPPLAGFDREIRDSMIVPAFLPPFSEVRLANDGSVWLRWSAVERNRWLVLSTDGSVECQVLLPERTELRLLDRGAWAFMRDEDGVPSVVMFPTGCG